jgi:nucleoside-diphosphate-sugar epimerase
MTASRSTLLITGSSGLLGCAVFEALRSSTSWTDVLLAGRHAAGRPLPVLGPDCRVEALALDLEGDVVLPPGIDTVLHIAGEKKDPARMPAVNHEGARRLAEAAVRAGVRRFVHVSSVGVYGALPGSGDVHEDAPHVPRNLYEQTKDAGERAAAAVCAQAGLPCVVMRPSNVLGLVPGQSHPLLGLVRNVRRGRLVWFGRAPACANYVCVEDVAAALLAAAAGQAPASEYIVNTPAPLAQVVAWMADELGVQAPTSRWPLWSGRLLVAALALAGAATGGAMPFDRDRLTELTNTTRYVGDALTRDAGFRYPVGIEAFVRRLVRHYLQQGLA